MQRYNKKWSTTIGIINNDHYYNTDNINNNYCQNHYNSIINN